MIPSSELEPAPDVPALDELPDADAAAVLERLAVIKLNGGLATSMGLQEPKSLLEARDGKTFLEIIVGQTLALRRRSRRAPATDPDEQREHARAEPRGPRALPRARDRRAATGLPAVDGAEARC